DRKNRECVLRLRNVVFEAGGKRLIDGLDLELFSGTKTVIMGPNGAGKSLALKLIQGLLEPASGDIVRPNEGADFATAMVFQRPTLLRRSVEANLDHALRVCRVGRADRRHRVEELLELGNLEHLRKQPARRLSGGEQQRLSVVRAMASRPKLLLLDEPTASLDPAATAAIEALVNEAHQGGTKIVFVTHDAGQARRIGDEVVFLHKGRLCEQTPAEEFFEQPVSVEAAAYLAGRLVL
ncbi:MAG TPA: ATP-binding cassette domain-containing protein, partial [Afifellaceae bacterium]|nr:ATP-binding cassette domain-containing protein [Afifellaceae bacterium]